MNDLVKWILNVRAAGVSLIGAIGVLISIYCLVPPVSTLYFAFFLTFGFALVTLGPAVAVSTRVQSWGARSGDTPADVKKFVLRARVFFGVGAAFCLAGAIGCFLLQDARLAAFEAAFAAAEILAAVLYGRFVSQYE